MKKDLLHSLAILAIGILFGGFLGYVFRPGTIGVIIGTAAAVRYGKIAEWRMGAIYGILIGFVVGGSLGALTAVGGTAQMSIYIGTGIGGAIVGAIAGGILSKVFTSKSSWFF